MGNFQYQLKPNHGRLTETAPFYNEKTWQEVENGWKAGTGLGNAPTAAETKILRERRDDYQAEQAFARSEKQWQKDKNNLLLRGYQKFSKALPNLWEGKWEEARGIKDGIYEEAYETLKLGGYVLATGVATLLAPFNADAEKFRDDMGLAMIEGIGALFQPETYPLLAQQASSTADVATEFGNYESGKTRTAIVLSVVSPAGWVKRIDTAADIARSARHAKKALEKVSPKLAPSETWSAAAPKKIDDTTHDGIALKTGESNDTNQALLEQLNPIVDLIEDGEIDIAKYQSALENISSDLYPKLFGPYVKTTPHSPTKYQPGTYNREVVYRHPDGNGEIIAISWEAPPQLNISLAPGLHSMALSGSRWQHRAPKPVAWSWDDALNHPEIKNKRLSSLGISPKIWATKRVERPGQSSHYHDHAGSDGLEMTIQGEGKEIRAELDKTGKLQPVEENALIPGVIHPIEPEVIHKVLNAGQKLMITLHIYIKAMDPSRLRVFRP